MLLGQSEPQGVSRQRYQRIAQAFSASVLAKGVNLIVLLISVPLTLGYLGPERYGLWIAMTSVLSWLAISDIGLANGLMNLLADAHGRERPDQAQGYVAATFWGLALIALLVGIVSTPLSEWVDWRRLLNIGSSDAAAELRSALLLAIWCFALSLPLSVVPKVYIAHQEGALASAWSAVSSVGGLAAIVLVTHWNGGLVALTAAFFGCQTLVNLLSAVHLFGVKHRKLRPSIRLVNLDNLRAVLPMSALFFLSQIQSLLVFQTDVLVISHFLGPSAVTPYSVTFRLFAYVNVPLQLATPYFLSAIGEANARRDFPWIRLAFRRLLLASVVWAVPAILGFTIFYAPVITAWAGRQAVPGQGLVLWMGLWTFLLAFGTPMFVVLNATRNFARMVGFAYVAGVANVALSIIFVQRFGAAGVVAATALANGLCAVVPYCYETWKYLQSGARTRATTATGS